MAEFLTDEWFELMAGSASGLVEHLGLDLTVDHEIAGSPHGKVRFHVVFVDGRIAHVGPGKHGEADCSLAAGYEDARALLVGELSHDVAYMQGRLKVDGAYERWVFAMEPVRSSPEFASMVSSVAAATTFG